jgi:hypothetical protein
MSGKSNADTARKLNNTIRASREASRKRKAEREAHDTEANRYVPPVNGNGGEGGNGSEPSHNATPETDTPKTGPAPKAAKSTKAHKRQGNARGNGAAAQPLSQAALFALFDAITDDAEFADALLKYAPHLGGHKGDLIRRYKARKKAAAGVIDMAAVHATIDRCLDLSPEEYAARLKSEARGVNLSAQKLDELVKAKRDQRRAEVRARDRALGLTNTPPPDGVFRMKAALAFFNDKYFVSHEGGRVFICEPRYDPVLRRRYVGHIRSDDFKLLHANRRVLVGEDEQGKPLCKDAVPWWFKHAERREYTAGIVFRPNGQVDADEYNLWQGFAPDLKEGPPDYPRFKDHLLNVTCAGDSSLFDYLWGWMAYCVQHPAERGHVAVVMIGKEGAGKSIVSEIFARLFGQHAFTVSDAKHLTGNFNHHLRDCIVLNAEEVFAAGNKAAESTLRYLITSPALVVEGKGANVIVVPNCLHILMTANPGWVVPTSLGDRRFFVLHVSDRHVRDFPYFKAINQEMENGGYAALLHDLQNHDLRDFNIRAVPATEGLTEQKKLSLELHVAWWKDVLDRGYVFESRLGLGDHFAQWHDPISKELLYKSYEEHARARGERRPLSREALGRFLSGKDGMGGRGTRLRGIVIGEQWTDVDQGNGFKHREAALLYSIGLAHAYEFGDLEEARQKFVAKTELSVDWGDETNQEDAGDAAAEEVI